MTVLGILIFLAGVGSLGYGIYSNNNMDIRVDKLFNEGVKDPGTLFIVLGVVGLILGLVLIIVGAINRKV